MRNESNNKHVVDIVFVLALFCVFAACALMLVTLGANVYKRTVNEMDANYSSRTAFAYITEKLRQNDSQASLSLDTLNGSPAVLLTQDFGGDTYLTYLYLDSDGYLKELFIKKGTRLGSGAPAEGQKILELRDFQAEQLSDSLFYFSIVSKDNEEMTLYVASRCSAF